ncbi:MAG TPA: hydrogenase, partial [Anaeromyxobacter sp.]|nr:hydrogenase [Anaeromyxobacter sp.]
MSTAEKTIRELDALEGAPVLVGRPGDRALTDELLEPVLGKTRKGFVLLVLALLGGVGFWTISLVT